MSSINNINNLDLNRINAKWNTESNVSRAYIDNIQANVTILMSKLNKMGKTWF